LFRSNILKSGLIQQEERIEEVSWTSDHQSMTCIHKFNSNKQIDKRNDN